MRDARLIFLQRLVDRDGRLAAHNIDPETDVDVILALEAAEMVQREFRGRIVRGPKLTGVTITATGREFLARSTYQ
jgi:hypothetical protein